MVDKPVVSVVVRTHQFKRNQMLKRAILSLVVQQDVLIEIIVMTQGFDTREITSLTEWIDADVKSFPNVVDAVVVNVGEIGTVSDLRSQLLNRGVRIANGEYLALLDDDDLIYHYAYKQLISDIQRSNAAVAFGRCVRVEGVFRGGNFQALSKSTPYQGESIIDLIVDNFCPIHSYIFDLKKIDINDLFFDEDLPYLEDYRLLLRLIPKYKFSFLSMHENICEYWFYQDKSNTTNKSADRFSLEAKGWREAYLLTEKLKSELSLSVRLIDLELWARNKLHGAIPNDVIIDAAFEKIEDMVISRGMFCRR